METFKAQTPIEEFAVGVTRRNGILGNGKPATEMTFESGAFSQLRSHRPSPLALSLESLNSPWVQTRICWFLVNH